VLQESFPKLNIVAAREIHEDADRAYSEVRALLTEHADLLAIYCIGAGQEGIARAMTEFGREKSVIFIGHDLTDNTRQYLLSGVMDAAIDQNARVEAREAVDRLVRTIRNEANISSATIRIQSVFRENIPNET
jgi:LacI family transcriptional regulator